MRPFAITCVVCVLAAATAAADDLQWSVDADLGSAYVWRGQVATDELVFQPAVTASWQGFSFNLWANLDLTDRNDQRGDFTEVDLTASYGGEAGAVAWGLGVVSYEYPDSGGDTVEAFASAAMDVLLQPSITLYCDFVEIDGCYASLGIGHGFEITDRVALDLGVSAGWGSGAFHRGYLDVNEATWSDGLAEACLAVQLSDRTALGFNLRCSWMWETSVRAAAREACGDDSLIFGSVVLSVNL